MQLVHLKYYQLNRLTEKSDEVLCGVEPQELLTKKAIHKPIFEGFGF